MEYNRWFIIETQLRTDGDVNLLTTEKSSGSAALNYYYTRCAAYAGDTTYPGATVMLCNYKLEVVKKEEVTTAYKVSE